MTTSRRLRPYHLRDAESAYRFSMSQGSALAPCYEWGVRPQAVKDACEVLGVTWPVTISSPRLSLVKLPSGFEALYACAWREEPLRRRHAQRHLIIINAMADPAYASCILWHELTHAAQAEAHGSPWAFWESVQDSYPDYPHLNGGVNYWSHPVERPALENEIKHFTHWRLTTYRHAGKLTRITI